MTGVTQDQIDAFLGRVEFDADWYLREYPDVGQLDMSPAEHFLWLGQRLGRRASALELKPGVVDYQALSSAGKRMHFTRGVGEVVPLAKGDQLSATPTIAVAIHLFYDDLIDEFCEYLAHIPLPFTAMFSIRDEGVIPTVQAALTRHRLNCRPLFQVMQNRGRNFGPWLVDFREEIARHDLLLHIHTKKSLRHGHEERRWRTHLLTGLLGTRELAGSIIETFNSVASTGLVFPDTWPDMPPWCHHWLSTGHRIDEISGKLGIAGMPRRGQIDFSVGSMFWARTKALTPMLAYPWRYEEFEEEPIGDDGSMAHVLERALTSVCSLSGYDFCEIDVENQILRRNWSEKLLHRYRDAQDSATWAVANCETLSFDFFDTLFARHATTPEDVQSYIGWVLQCRGLITDEKQFLPARKGAEAKARQCCGKGDIDIDDIYGAWQPGPDWSPTAIATARSLEWDIETRTLVPRSDVMAAARSMRDKGGRTIIVSDTYMPTAFFQGVLANHGAGDLFDSVYVSAALGKRKDRGDIWPWLYEQEVRGRRFFHFGDNEHSDMQVPAKLQIGNFQVLNTTSLASLYGFGPQEDWRVGRLDWRDGLIHGPLIARFCANAFPRHDSLRPVRLSDPVDIGYALLGPLFFGFVTAIMERARRDKPQGLYFLAREGWFLQQQYERMRALMGTAGADLPEGRYLCVSRRAVLGAMAGAMFDAQLIMRGSVFRGHFAAFLLARLGFTLPDDHPLATVEIDSDARQPELLALLADLQADIMAAGRPRSERMLRYFAQEGIDRPNSIIVDIGYSGTIQSGIQSLTGTPLAGLYMATSPLVDTVLGGMGTASAYFSDRGEQCAVRDFSMILEAILTAPHGQTTDYREDGARMVPIYGSGGLSQKKFAYLAELNAGATAYISDLLRIYGPEIALANFSPRECEWGLRAIVSGTLQPDDRFWGSLSVEDNFCGYQEHDVRALYRLDN